MVRFCKYHSLGNDYIIIDPKDSCQFDISKLVRAVCDRHHGIGADGVLLGPILHYSHPNQIKLRIFNSDGSEAEKSGNGIRIFAGFLYEYGLVHSDTFSIFLNNESVLINIIDIHKQIISIDMEKPNFSTKTFVHGLNLDEIIDLEYKFNDINCRISFVEIGNPHCVIYGQPVTKDMACKLGPIIESSVLFPYKVNVQLLEIISNSEIRIQIWERGSGYTLASGSSSCAAVAVANKMGLVGNKVTVSMPGGNLDVILKEHCIRLVGPITKIMDGILSTSWLNNIRCNI